MVTVDRHSVVTTSPFCIVSDYITTLAYAIDIAYLKQRSISVTADKKNDNSPLVKDFLRETPLKFRHN